MGTNDGKKALTIRLPERKARVIAALTRLQGVSIGAMFEGLVDGYIEQNRALLSDQVVTGLGKDIVNGKKEGI